MEPVLEKEFRPKHPLEDVVKGPHFKLTKVPMPPSSNHQYWYQPMPGQGGKQVCRPTPTSDLKKFHKELETWKNQNLVAVHKCRSKLIEWRLRQKQIRVDVVAFWSYFDLFTREGTPKRTDVSNRLKALHDGIAEMMDMDDSWFWSITAHKAEIKGTEPWNVVIFSPVEHMSLTDMKERGIL